MTRYSVSQPVTQVEAPRLLTGQGQFADDITLPRQAYAVFLRSPHAHADIKSVDISAAAQMPGVIAILTGADYAADGLGEVRGISPAKRRDGSQMFRPPRPALVQDRVRHVGHAVAMVIAESVNAAKDAAEAIEVDYAPLPANLATATANAPDAPLLYEGCANNEPMSCARPSRSTASPPRRWSRAPWSPNTMPVATISPSMPATSAPMSGAR
jgi:carbon-monoxide dehydrogenase large subunit